MKFSLTFSELTADEARHLLAQGGGQAPLPGAQAGYAPQPPAQPAYQPQPPAQPAYQPQPPAQPAYQPQPPMQVSHQDVMAAMQTYAATYKPAGVKALFAKKGLPPNVAQLDANGLAIMLQAFRSGEAPN